MPHNAPESCGIVVSISNGQVAAGADLPFFISNNKMLRFRLPVRP